MNPNAVPVSGDPLFSQGVDFTVLLIVAGKAVLTFAVLLVSVLFMVWFERKVISDMQNRVGPDKAGKWGLLQSLADGIKLFFKEDLLPDQADRKVFRLAPYLAAVPAFLAFSIVPLGGMVTIAGRQTRLQLADPPIGILFLLAMSSVAVYGVMLAGWSSGSKYPLLGSVRASAQMVSYEAALALSVAAVVLTSGSLVISDIVDFQAGASLLGRFPGWNIFQTAFIPFFVFLIAATAELNRPPFDLVEAEQELVGGFHTEYSSLRFALFFLAEFMNTVTMSAIAVTLFLGGPAGPVFAFLPWLWPVLWFVAKTFLFLFMYVWFRATLPRLRYDQLMDLGWKVLIPISLLWLLVLAGMKLGNIWGFAVFGAGLVGWGMLTQALKVGRAAGESRVGAH